MRAVLRTLKTVFLIAILALLILAARAEAAEPILLQKDKATLNPWTFPATGYIKAPPVPVVPQQNQEGREHLLTFYSCEELKPPCIGRWTGTRPVEGRTVASNVWPAGTELYITGWGYYTVEDTGSGLGPNQLDIFIDSYTRAMAAGVQTAMVYRVR